MGRFNVIDLTLLNLEKKKEGKIRTSIRSIATIQNIS